MSDSCVLWLRFQRPLIPSDQLHAAIQRFPNVEVLDTADDNAVKADLPRITAAFSDMPIPDDLVSQMPALRWVHTTRGGAFPYLVPSVRERGITITTSTGAHGDSYGEFAMACILGWANRLPFYWKAQQAKKWDQSVQTQLIEGKTLLVIGLGNGGTAVASRAHALGMRVVATKRTVDAKPAYVDRLETPDGLHDLLPLADFVAITVAGVQSTVNIVGEEELRKLQKHAFLIGLTQARAVDHTALTQALREERLAGAVLNMLPQEPLPSDSELWDVPNLFIVPHTAGAARDWQTVLEIFERNLAAFVSGGRLSNIVDPALGY